MATRAKTNSETLPRHNAIHQAVRRHYYALMPAKKHHRVLIWVVFFSVSALIGIQMAYPQNRAVPFARLGSAMVGWQSQLHLAQTIGSAFESAQITLTADGIATKPIPLATTGAEPDTTSMVMTLTDYPFWQRFIPGSIFWQQPTVATWELQYATKPLTAFANAHSGDLSRDAINANLEIQNGVLLATDESNGVQTTAAQVVTALHHVPIAYSEAAKVVVPSTITQPQKTAKNLADVRAQAEAALARPLSIQADGKTFTPTDAEKASWLRLGDDANGTTTLTINMDTFGAYIDARSKEVGTPAVQTNVTLQDGREVARTVGVTGTKIDSTALIDLIRGYLVDGTGRSPFIAELVPVQPSVIYDNTYSATETALRAYIADQAKQGAWISIRQLDGARWTADADATDSVVSGSTYKLYVALYLFKEMDEGKRDWNTPILDTDTSTCFDRMTIASTNPCAEEWIQQFGPTNLNNYLYSLGFSRATTFTDPEAAHTSALDLTTYMTGLEQGTLIGGAHRDRLLYSLSHHPYRYGIPAGSAGQVWDKVGYVWDYVNDAAIIHHPKGTYVMTIMTKGQSYAAIAAMTREIEKIMYP